MKKVMYVMTAIAGVLLIAPAAFAQAAEPSAGMARNPGAAGSIRAAMILGLVFVETLVLFTLAMLALKT